MYKTRSDEKPLLQERKVLIGAPQTGDKHKDGQIHSLLNVP